jgi:hypothetical protein
LESNLRRRFLRKNSLGDVARTRFEGPVDGTSRSFAFSNGGNYAGSSCECGRGRLFFTEHRHGGSGGEDEVEVLLGLFIVVEICVFRGEPGHVNGGLHASEDRQYGEFVHLCFVV